MRTSHIVLAVSAILLAAPSAWAQRPAGRGAGGFGEGLMLIGQESVQQELKLSEEQIKKVDEYLAKQRETFSGLRDLSREQRREKLAELGKSGRETLDAILDETQRTRLHQITLQQRGPRAMADPQVAEALSLDDEQKSRLQELADKAREEMRNLFQGAAGGDRTELRKKIEAARAAVGEKIQGVLTPEQQAKWKELIGEPFKGEIRFRRGAGTPDGARRRRRDNAESTRVDRAGPFRFAAFRHPGDNGDDDSADDDADGKKSDAKGKKESDDNPSRAKRRPQRGHRPAAHRRSAAPRDSAHQRHAARDRAWARVAHAVAHPDHPRGPWMGRRGPGHRGHAMRWAMHRRHGDFDRPHHRYAPSFRGDPQRFWAFAGHHRHSHLRHHGHGYHGRMLAQRPYRGHHGPRMSDAHHRHGRAWAHRPPRHGPPPHFVASHHRHGPPRSFSFAGHHFPGHHGHVPMHMTGFKRHQPHGQFSEGKRGDHRRDDAYKHRSGSRHDDDRKKDRDED